MTTPALLVLEDGRTFRGEAYGAVGETFGEAVFSTGMLLVTWRWGGRRLRTAFRCDDRDRHAVLQDAINARLTVEATR